MSLVYQLSIFMYTQLLKLVALWHPKAKLMIEGRKQTLGILQQFPKGQEKRFWFHCASLGEYDMALPLIKACQEANPGAEIFLSFYSPSGMQHYHKRGFIPTAVFYLPADTKKQMREVVNAVAADRLYLLKYEFWPILLAVAKNAKLEVAAVSTILRPNQIYFKWYGGLFRKALKQVAFFAVQNEGTQQLLLKLGVASQQIEMLGDLRWNRVFEAKKAALQNEVIETFKADKPLLILGSSWPQEESILASFLEKNQGQNEATYKILVAPHDLSSAHLENLKSKFPNAVFYSEFIEAQEKTQEKAQEEFNDLQEGKSLSSQRNTTLTKANIFILDTIGQLSAAYQYGNIAFVGGGFSGNLHNILEPAAYGLPILFGPKHDKFPEADQLLLLGYAQEVADAEGLKASLEKFAQWNEASKMQMMAQLESLQARISDRLLT